jgi:hypothetical protein
MFKAPQKTLRTSWVEIVYTKPKAMTIIKKSLSRNATPIIKSRGVVASNSHNYLY